MFSKHNIVASEKSYWSHPSTLSVIVVARRLAQKHEFQTNAKPYDEKLNIYYSSLWYFFAFACSSSEDEGT